MIAIWAMSKDFCLGDNRHSFYDEDLHLGKNRKKVLHDWLNGLWERFHLQTFCQLPMLALWQRSIFRAFLCPVRRPIGTRPIPFFCRRWSRTRSAGSAITGFFACWAAAAWATFSMPMT